MTDNPKTSELAGAEPEPVSEVTEELLDSSDASGAHLRGEDDLLTRVTNAVPGADAAGGDDLPYDLALYSLSSGEVVYRTAPDGSLTFIEQICDDLLYSKVVGYLKHHGAPVLDHPSHQAYLTALETGLRQGLSPEAAREEAIRTIKIN